MNAAALETRMETLEGRLEWGLTSLQLIVNKDIFESLLHYVRLLQKWNRAYNLTSIRDPLEMVNLHLLDSLAVLRALPQGSLLDVGSGAGLPGIPLALAQPERKITLIDCIDKKTSFLRQVVAELKLANVEVVRERVENWHPNTHFDCIISRAFADLAPFVQCSAHLLSPGGVFVAMKGRFPDEEISRLPIGYTVKCASKLNVAGLEAERHLILVERT